MKSLKTAGLMFACLGLTACVSPIQKMPANEALQFGTNQFYEMPSYRMDMSAKLINMGVTGAKSDTDVASTDTFNKYLNFFGKKFIFNGTGIIDTVNDQYQIIPEYGYEAKNINGHIRFPIVLDRKAKLLYTDLSALDGLVTNIDNAGKYSRFDLSKLPIAPDADKKLVDIMRKYSYQMLGKIPAERINELPLTAEDRKLNAVRKLQFDLKPQDQIAMFPSMWDEMIDALIPPRKDNAIGDSAKSSAAKAQEMTEDIKHNAGLVKELGKLFSPESRDQYTVSFNRAGQIVTMRADSNYLINPDAMSGDLNQKSTESAAPKGGFQMHFITDMTVTDIGKAKLIDPPTAENSVDGIENLKNSPIGKSFADKFDSTNNDATTDAAQAVEEAAASPVKKAKKPMKKKR